jgi:predicted lipoprotein with Yx(FWY)xxD motif
VQRSKRVLLALGVGAALTGGGVGLAAASSSSATAPPTVSTTGTVPARSATVNVATATVGGRSEEVLVDAKGLPLYTYNGDTATRSEVSGGLAALWPPLVSGSPSESGANGKLTVVTDANGHQVLYNGHFLYTFVDDSPGHVTGQGVSNFFVATPNVRPIKNATTVKAAPAPASSSRGYGY